MTTWFRNTWASTGPADRAEAEGRALRATGHPAAPADDDGRPGPEAPTVG